MVDTIGNFLDRLRNSADTLDVIERQKVLRLVVKEILVHNETIKIKHSIPVTRAAKPSGPSGGGNVPSYLLCSGSHFATFGEYLPALRLGPMGEMVARSARAWRSLYRAVCG